MQAVSRDKASLWPAASPVSGPEAGESSEDVDRSLKSVASPLAQLQARLTSNAAKIASKLIFDLISSKKEKIKLILLIIKIRGGGGGNSRKVYLFF